MGPFAICLAVTATGGPAPLFWAVLIAWIGTVVLHELAHGVVAWVGGDREIGQRGGLSLNPLRYVDPVGSLLIPAFILMQGGMPLPGGVTYVRREHLRHRAWEVAVSLAGPATNFGLFLLCVLPLHPRLGWVDPDAPPAAWSTGQQFLATLGTLQFLTAAFNLIPLPPLDGFQAIAPFLGRDIQRTLAHPAVAAGCLIGLYALLQSNNEWIQPVFGAKNWVLDHLGMADVREAMRTAYNDTMHRR